MPTARIQDAQSIGHQARIRTDPRCPKFLQRDVHRTLDWIIPGPTSFPKVYFRNALFFLVFQREVFFICIKQGEHFLYQNGQDLPLNEPK